MGIGSLETYTVVKLHKNGNLYLNKTGTRPRIGGPGRGTRRQKISNGRVPGVVVDIVLEEEVVCPFQVRVSDRRPLLRTKFVQRGS